MTCDNKTGKRENESSDGVSQRVVRDFLFYVSKNKENKENQKWRLKMV